MASSNALEDSIEVENARLVLSTSLIIRGFLKSFLSLSSSGATSLELLLMFCSTYIFCFDELVG